MSDLGGSAGGHAKVGKAENKRGTKRTASARLDDEPKGNAPAKPGPMSFATRGGGTVSLDNDNDGTGSRSPKKKKKKKSSDFLILFFYFFGWPRL